PPGDVADTAARDSTALSGRRSPNVERDGPGRTAVRSPGSDSPCRDAAARAVALAESFVSARRLLESAPRHRVASPLGWRRTPDAETFQRERARPRRGLHP